uniref:Hypotheticial protein n=1 Tax=Schistosoma japonicum TaxID=6182 RepID=C1LEE1_SCHJA|nr:hypotheticial protein [Schistosoma japonicum]
MKVKQRKTNKVEGDNEEVFIRLGNVPLDILRFNISMQSGAERKETRKSLLLKMGAKKPKNKYINYKELMQNRAKANVKPKCILLNVVRISLTKSCL